MAEGNNPKSDTVGLFLRAMVDREPGKRKVKPSKAALIDLADLDLGESSDDSDFNVDEAKLKEDDDISINSDPDDENDFSEIDEDEDEAEEEEADKPDCQKNRNVKGNLTISDLLSQAQEKQALSLEQGINRPKILVCAICLGEHSDDTNEIVTCDGCHVSVHEGCYGISDTISVSSTVSSSSTEPWFCDACKAGVTNPPCELCPNLGYTIFKETEMGRWVHLVCALYVPGVAFSEVDKLSFPTLFEMPYSRYGSKACSLCEDERFCRTGVCIGCDAGMCRSYFHVTCAQKEGLLSEVNHGEADQADPYYAHCKLHTDRELMRRRKRNWLALQLHMKQGEKEKLCESQETQDRLQRKLIKYREKYLFTKANRPAPWFPTQKMPRSFSNCASFFRSLLHKTKLMGIETESHGPESQTLGDVRKKWHISPAFNIEFISYYLDRNSRLQEMKSKLDFLLKENEELMKEETKLRNRYNSLSKESRDLEIENAELLNKSLELHDLLKGLAGRPLRLPPVVAALHNPPYVDVEAGAGGVPGGKEKRLITKAAAKMITGNLPTIVTASMDVGQAKTMGKRSPSSGLNFGGMDNGVMSIHTCSVCMLTKEQHLLIQCDTCSNYYHLSCLDPPLTRMPKKTKQMGWQCSDCCKSSDSDKAPEIDTAAPRRLRRVIKEPSKFSPSVSKDQKVPDRPAENDVKTDMGSGVSGSVSTTTPTSNSSPAPTASSKVKTQKGGVKRRLSVDAKRGKKKVRRRSLDTPRKGNAKTPKEGINIPGAVLSTAEGIPGNKSENPRTESSSVKDEMPFAKVELESLQTKNKTQNIKPEKPTTTTTTKPPINDSKPEASQIKSEVEPSQINSTKVELKVEGSISAPNLPTETTNLKPKLESSHSISTATTCYKPESKTQNSTQKVVAAAHVPKPEDASSCSKASSPKTQSTIPKLETVITSPQKQENIKNNLKLEETTLVPKSEEKHLTSKLEGSTSSPKAKFQNTWLKPKSPSTIAKDKISASSPKSEASTLESKVQPSNIKILKSDKPPVIPKSNTSPLVPKSEVEFNSGEKLITTTKNENESPNQVSNQSLSPTKVEKEDKSLPSSSSTTGANRAPPDNPVRTTRARRSAETITPKLEPNLEIKPLTSETLREKNTPIKGDSVEVSGTSKEEKTSPQTNISSIPLITTTSAAVTSSTTPAVCTSTTSDSNMKDVDPLQTAPPLSSSSSSSSLATTSTAVSSSNNNISLDASAESLPSPHSESFPSEEDPTCPSRKEKKHREGGKKKKKDRDKEEGGRKRKKHHRERHQMASEIVSPFRIKIKPLPPRPNGAETSINVSRSQSCDGVASHTTSTTTAPPGYPPLPPGYKLTQPMMVASSTSQAQAQDMSANSVRTQAPSSSSNSSSGSTTTIYTAASLGMSSTVCRNSGRRKSDPGAEQFSKCDVCGETGGVTNTVMCDECLKAYHFNCLDPPLKKSPKRRGYSWFCEDCDNAATSNNHENK